MYYLMGMVLGQIYILFIMVAGSGCRGRESIEDQVSADISDVVQASKSDLMARGIAVDLLEMAKRVSPQYEATEHKDLSGEEGFSLDSVITDDRRGHRILSSTAQWNSQ